MTNKQMKTIELINKLYLKQMHGEKFVEDYEIKEWEVKELECGIVSLLAESGQKDDEGTMAQYLCRNRIHIFIGKKGGIYWYNNNFKKVTGKVGMLFSIYYKQMKEMGRA